MSFPPLRILHYKICICIGFLSPLASLCLCMSSTIVNVIGSFPTSCRLYVSDGSSIDWTALGLVYRQLLQCRLRLRAQTDAANVNVVAIVSPAYLWPHNVNYASEIVLLRTHVHFSIRTIKDQMGVGEGLLFRHCQLEKSTKSWHYKENYRLHFAVLLTMARQTR
jgi:hypothetical protein